MNTLKYWLDCWEHVHDVLDLDTARYAIATLAVQEEIDWRLQHRIFEDGELEANMDGWPSVSACAALSNVGRSTAPGFTPFERMIEIHERPQRHRDKAAALAQKLLSRLPPRYQAAVLLAGWQLEAPRQPLADDLHETCPREITIQGIWSIQDVLSERLQLPAHKPFPSANALNIAAVRGRNMMMLEVDDVCGHLIKWAA